MKRHPILKKENVDGWVYHQMLEIVLHIIFIVKIHIKSYHVVLLEQLIHKKEGL